DRGSWNHDQGALVVGHFPGRFRDPGHVGELYGGDSGMPLFSTPYLGGPWNRGGYPDPLGRWGCHRSLNPRKTDLFSLFLRHQKFQSCSMSNYHIKTLEEYFHVYRKSVRNPEAFWEEVAEEHFLWRKRWDKVLEWDFEKPEIKWFEGAKLNITENCIDRHLGNRGEKTAILFVPNDPKGKAQHITYRELHERVCKFANVLKEQ